MSELPEKPEGERSPTPGVQEVDPFDWTPLGPDRVLQQLVDLGNSTPVRFGISLQTGGFLVSGTLASGKDYFEGVASEMADAYKNSGSENLSDSIRKYFLNFGLVYDQVNEETDKQLPMYIHLKDAKFFHNSGAPFPGNMGVWWRGRISSVSGYVMGTLSADN